MMEVNDKIIEIAAEKMMLNHHGIMNGYSMDYCRGIVQEIVKYLQEQQINSLTTSLNS